MTLLENLSGPVWQQLTWTLLHFLWQGAFVAIALAIALWALPSRRPQARYAVCLAAMVCLAMCPLATFLLSGSAGGRAAGQGVPHSMLDAIEELGATPRPVVHSPPTSRALSDRPARGLTLTPWTNSSRRVPSSGAATSRPLLSDCARAAQPYLLIAWITGVFVLSGRLLLGLAGLRWLRRWRQAAPEELVACLARLCERLGVRSVPKIFVSGRIHEAIAVGLLRPTILVPAAWLAEMTPEVLEAVIAHELAHIRRWDLWVNLLQRFVETLLFYHPAVWWVSRRVSAERELCCDELAVAVTGRRLGYAVALERAASIRLASTEPVFGAAFGGRNMALRDRVRHILGVSGTASNPMARWWPAGLMALLVPLGIWLSSAALAAQPQPTAAGPAATKQFELTVVGPDGKPVPNACVIINTRLKPTEWTVTRGKYIKMTETDGFKYGPLMRADSDGRLAFELPEANPDVLILSIATDGYAPWCAIWDRRRNPDPIPSQYTAHLDAAKSVGGVVVDEAGKPIEGVAVHPSIEPKNRVGHWYVPGVELVTDAQGKWICHNVPVTMDSLNVFFKHPEYASTSILIPTREFALEGQREPTAKTVLKPAVFVTVTGKVTDEHGTPIAGATVRGAKHQATTDKDGLYQLVDCEPLRTDLTVTAKGRAPASRFVEIRPDMPSVDFKLEPGRTIRIRVVDAKGNPIPNTWIVVALWQGHSDHNLGLSPMYTDRNGVWQWNEAPADAIRCAICSPGGLQFDTDLLVARAEEYVITALPALVISGRVVDAETKQPIKKFDVVEGYQNQPGGPNTWARGERHGGREGHYRLQPRDFYATGQIRIEADGYLPAVSRAINENEGTVTIDFELKKGKQVAAAVLSPDGSPAQGANVVLGIPGASIEVHDGNAENFDNQGEGRVTDDQGRFEFPPQVTPFQLIVTHPSGYVNVSIEPGKFPGTIRLEPWGRVEGTLRIGSKVGAGERIRMTGWGERHQRGALRIDFQSQTSTDENGHFMFDRVAPRKWSVGQGVIFNVRERIHAETTLHGRRIEVQPGQTVHVDLGGTGRPVVGKLLPPEGVNAKLNWGGSLVYVHAKTPRLPEVAVPEEIKGNKEKTEAWWANWKTTDEGKAWIKLRDEGRAQQRAKGSFGSTINQDGSFRVEDVPADEYELTVQAHEFPQSASSGPEPVAATLYHTFAVPPMPGGRSDEPLDLGNLTLKRVPERKASR